jgi:16S rRNA (uracil1498-N3)-methyltransferase
MSMSRSAHAGLHRIPRLFHEGPLAAGGEVALAAAQAHYLRNVMRLAEGDAVRLFNGRDGEWLCVITALKKKAGAARCEEKLAEPAPPPDIDYVFAPLKTGRLDYIAQKATEMGARRLRPVLTRHTVARRVNRQKLLANAIEAAEQCNLVFVPEVLEAEPLERVLAGWDETRRIIYCDEAAPIADPMQALARVPEGPLAVLIGPEGGFSPEEQAMLRRLPFVHAIRMGPRIMRADTAGVAALALVQAVLGDWRG